MMIWLSFVYTFSDTSNAFISIYVCVGPRLF